MTTQIETETNTDTKIVQDLIFILDESGSMDSMGKEPVEAVNKFIQEQKKTLGDDGANFSLWKFNSKVTKMIDDVPLKDVKEFVDFSPSDMTALYDAIGQAINTKKKKEKYDNVVCIILTDGLENSSVEYTLENIKSMTKEMESNHNWKFVYLGANQDAFAVGTKMGMDCCASYACAPGEMINVARNLSDAVSSYRTRSATIGQEATLNMPNVESSSSNSNLPRQIIGRQMSSV